MAERAPDLQIVALDTIYPGWDGLRAGADAALEHLLVPHSVGEFGRWRTWDWAEGRPAGRIEIDPTRPVLVEGAGILTRSSAALAQVAVWVEAPDAQRRARALARDGDTYVPHWDRWATQEEQHIAKNDPRRCASFIVEVA